MLNSKPTLLRQAHDRLRLALGRRAGAAVGLARLDRRGALLVVLEVLGVVAVRVDAVGVGGLAVAVVVAQVLAPQPLVGERVLVAVRVHDRDEPQLGRLEHLLGRLVVAAEVDVVVHQAAVDLRRDPLAGVLRRAEQHRRAAAVALAAGALRDLQREDLAALQGRADLDQLGELRVLGRELVHLVADAAGLVVRAPDGVAADGLRRRELLDGLAALDARELGLRARVADVPGLRLGQDHVRADVRAAHFAVGDVEALGLELRELVGGRDDRVRVQPVLRPLFRGRRRHGDDRERGRECGREAPSMHAASSPPRKT